MSIIDQIISIKKAASSQDLLTMIDEFILYGRLSRSSALGTLGDSPVLEKRLPLLTNVANGDMYATSLYLIACDIMIHLLGALPEHLHGLAGEMSAKQKQRLTIAQENTAKVNYLELFQYQTELHAEHVVAVYEHQYPEHTSIIIITHAHKTYDVFQGVYTPSEDEESDEIDIRPKPIVVTKNNMVFTMDGYSTQGNNAYYFATVTLGEAVRHLMLLDEDTLVVSANKQGFTTPDKLPIKLLPEEKNKMAMVIHSPEDFAHAILDIIIRWEEQVNA